jgi:hypothetical protein
MRSAQQHAMVLLPKAAKAAQLVARHHFHIQHTKQRPPLVFEHLRDLFWVKLIVRKVKPERITHATGDVAKKET